MPTLDVKWAHAPHLKEFEEAWVRAYGDAAPVPQRYVVGPIDAPVLNALVNREPVDTAGEDRRWHISISSPDRLPTWDDCVSAAHELRPGVVFVIAIPPKSWWINVHPYVLHLYEIRDSALVEAWREERRGDPHT